MDAYEFRTHVGRKIRQEREAQGLSLHKLADMVGTSYTHLWKVENAKVSVGLDLLARLAEALDVTVEELVRVTERR